MRSLPSVSAVCGPGPRHWVGSSWKQVGAGLEAPSLCGGKMRNKWTGSTQAVTVQWVVIGGCSGLVGAGGPQGDDGICAEIQMQELAHKLPSKHPGRRGRWARGAEALCQRPFSYNYMSIYFWALFSLPLTYFLFSHQYHTVLINQLYSKLWSQLVSVPHIMLDILLLVQVNFRIGLSILIK